MRFFFFVKKVDIFTREKWILKVLNNNKVGEKYNYESEKKVKISMLHDFHLFGSGSGGIRTPGTVARTSV